MSQSDSSKKVAQDLEQEKVGRGDRVRRRSDGWTGTVVHVYSQDYAAMTDHDVAVGWDNGRRNNESAADLEAMGG